MADNNPKKPINLQENELEEFDKVEPEGITAPEIPKDLFPEKEKPPVPAEKKEIYEAEPTQKKKAALPQLPVSVVPPDLIKSPTLTQIETILEDDLKEVYFKMEPELQQKFKTEGEKTAAKIEKILTQTKVKAKDIFKLILQWLKIIPGLNKFFIKQEAKIKTDKIIRLKKY